MSMLQVLLSIRQHRHTRCKLVRVGVWGWQALERSEGDPPCGSVEALQRLGLSQSQQLARICDRAMILYAFC